MIVSSSQMCCLRDNTQCFFDVRPRGVYLLQFQILTLFHMIYQAKLPKHEHRSFHRSISKLQC